MRNKMVYTECDFCKELNSKDNLYWKVAEKYNLPQNRTIFNGQHWVIWPTIGAIVPGYVMIISKRHHLSLRDCDKEEILELEKLLKYTRKILRDIYRYPCIAFEHGSGCNIGIKSSCIEHCHLHVLPLKEDVYNRINLKKFEIESIKSLHELSKGGVQSPSYLLYENHKEEFFVMHADVYVSQYFRQLIAISEGVPEKWDWRHNYFIENIERTIKEVSEILQNSLL
jgi:diadenosine tetraphosphate (Ap4A) HIT family hydrolase